MISSWTFTSAIGCEIQKAALWHQPMCDAMAEFEISSPRRIASFLAQVGHESSSLCVLEENLNYSAQRMRQVWPARFATIEAAHYYEHAPERLGNLVYAGRMGNGPYETGDGWRYRGRGPLQITGRNNYRDCGEALSVSLLAFPDALLQPIEGSRSAAWVWYTRNCNELADAQDNVTITRKINGGDLGLSDRLERYERAMAALA